MLPYQSNAVLSIVRIELRHVQVIDEVDEAELARRPELSASLLLKWLFQLRLEEYGVCVEVHIDGAA